MISAHYGARSNARRRAVSAQLRNGQNSATATATAYASSPTSTASVIDGGVLLAETNQSPAISNIEILQ